MKRFGLWLAALLMIMASAQADVLLRQDFNGSWPPAGWTPSPNLPGNNYWHLQGAGTAPWSADATSYAAIYWTGNNHDTDTLKSPVFNCAAWRVISLSCSTFYRPYIPAGCTAQILISTDTAKTWKVIRNYWADSVGPGPETYDIDARARLQPWVQLAWAWTGNLYNIHWWCLDNVTVTGIPAYDHDVATTAIFRPDVYETPNPPNGFAPSARFGNLGLNPESFTVNCDVYQGPVEIYTSTRSASLDPGTDTTISFDDFTTFQETLYDAYLSTYLVGDENTANDTLHRQFAMSYAQYVKHDDGSATGRGHWSLAGSGWGLTVTPNAYPATLLDAEFNLNVNDPVNGAGYKVRVVGDDGPGGGPGTTIYESPIINGQTGWNADSLQALQIEFLQDSFYLFYIQAGDWPNAPELNHDTLRSPNVKYWRASPTGYATDTSTANGDWMIRCWLSYAPTAQADTDTRTMYIAQPDDQLTLRPAGISFTPAARIENHGLQDLTSIPVVCSIVQVSPPTTVYTNTVTVPLLAANTGMLISFAPWTRTSSVTPWLPSGPTCPGDTIPGNDAQTKPVLIYQSYYTGGPDLDRYEWIDSDTLGGPVYSWIDTNNSNVAIQANTDLSVTVPIGFVFTYRGDTTTGAQVCNNGWMSLSHDGQGASWLNTPIPSPARPNDALYPFWDNMYAGYTPHSKVRYKTIGAWPDEKFVVIWQDMELFGGDTNDLVSYEAILDQATGQITFQYKDVVGGVAGSNYGKSATVGIENRDGTVGLQYLEGDSGASGYWPGNKLTSGRAIMFYQVSYDVGVAQMLTPPHYTVPGPIYPAFLIKNYGSSAGPFNARCRVVKASDSSIVWRDSFSFDYFPVGAESVVAFGANDLNPWNAVVGTYLVKCSTELANDSNSNNALATTIYVQAWLQKADIPSGVKNRRVKYGALCSDGTYLYALKGASTNEFWRYNLARDTWDTLPEHAGRAENKTTKDGCALTYGNGYVYATKGGNTREFYTFNVARDSWRTRDSIVLWASGRGARNGTCLAYASGLVYMLKGNNTREFMLYDPARDTWRILPEINKVGTSNRKVSHGASVSWDGSRYLYAFKGSSTDEFWRYDMLSMIWDTLKWVKKGPSNRKIKAGAGSAYVNGKVYLLKGGNTTEFWAYDVAQDSWRQKTDIPIGPLLTKVKTGGAMTATNTSLAGIIYALKGGNRDEMWVYGPAFDTLLGFARYVKNDVQTGQPLHEIMFACRAAPNPSIGPITVSLAMPEALPARIKVYDVTGKLINLLYDGRLSVGYHNLTWNGRDLAGRAVASGVYLLKFESAKYEETQKLILQR